MRTRSCGAADEGVEPVNEALGMNPAERMLADLELSGIVADDDGVLDVTMGFDAPHRAPSVATITEPG